MKNMKVIMPFFIILLLLFPKYSWAAVPPSLENWPFLEVQGEQQKQQDGSLRIKGDSPSIIIKNLAIEAEKDYILTLRTRIEEDLCFMGIWWFSNSQSNGLLPPIPLISNGGFQTYIIDLRESSEWKRRIDGIGIKFVGCEKDVFMEEITISHPQSYLEALSIGWGNFWRAIPIYPTTINYIHSPFVFGFSFILLLNTLVIILITIVGLYTIMSKKVRTKNRGISIILAILFFAWISYDIRNSYNEYHIAKTATVDPLRPVEYYEIKDFYRFIQFLKDLLLKEKITEFNFYTDSIPYIEYTKYSLYPIRLRANKNETDITDIYVIYKNPSFYAKGGMLYQKGEVVAQGDLIAVYDNSSFVFRTR